MRLPRGFEQTLDPEPCAADLAKALAEARDKATARSAELDSLRKQLLVSKPSGALLLAHRPKELLHPNRLPVSKQSVRCFSHTRMSTS